MEPEIYIGRDWSPSELGRVIGVSAERVRQLYRDGRIPEGERVEGTDLIKFPPYPRIIRGERGPGGEVGRYIDKWEADNYQPVRDVDTILGRYD